MLHVWIFSAQTQPGTTMSLSKTPRCSVCNTTENVLQCLSCKVIFYCGKQHQTIDRTVHRKVCGLVKKYQENIAALDREMLQLPPDMVGLYSVNRIVKQEVVFLNDDSLVKELLNIKTFDAVAKALNHSMEVLRKHRINHLDLHHVVPASLLRLGKD